MNDKELADHVVAILSEFYDWGDKPSQATGRYGAESWHLPKIAHDFVRDWRVAGALMERVRKVSVEAWCKLLKQLMHEFDNRDLHRAIIEACVSALS